MKGLGETLKGWPSERRVPKGAAGGVALLTDASRFSPPAGGADLAAPRFDRPAAASRAASPLLDSLTDINLDDLFDAAGLMCLRRSYLQRLLWPAARRFALVALEFDELVGKQGLAIGSAWLSRRMAAGTRISGGEHVPATGPVFVLANHPGMTDAVSLLACLASRPDLRVIALDRPFLRALPNVAKHLIMVADHEVGRMGALRAGVRHLKQGGALLTFPAGHIEPDPATFGLRKAVESTLGWSASSVLFARRVPQTRFIPAVVSNVLSRAAQRHVLTLLRRTAQDKQRLAAALQVALPRYQKLVVRVTFGPPKVASSCGVELLQAEIVDEICRLIEASVDPAEDGAEQVRMGRSTQLHPVDRFQVRRPSDS